MTDEERVREDFEKWIDNTDLWGISWRGQLLRAYSAGRAALEPEQEKELRVHLADCRRALSNRNSEIVHLHTVLTSAAEREKNLQEALTKIGNYAKAHGHVIDGAPEATR